MKTLSVILAALVAAFGLYTYLIKNNPAGIILFIIGSLCFAILRTRTVKPDWYDKDHFMNK